MLHLNPALAGERRYHTSLTSGLPYLFKILSVRTALSIQVRVRVRARVWVSLQDTLGPQGSLDTGATRQGLSLSLTLTLTRYAAHLAMLHTMYNLFRGRKYNLLRRRTDSCEYDLEQQLLGTLLFVP